MSLKRSSNFGILLVGKKYVSWDKTIYFVCDYDIDKNIFYAVILNSTTIFKFNEKGKCLENFKDKESQNLWMCLD